MCNEGGDQAQGWLDQLWQWQDFNGGGWFVVIILGLVVLSLLCWALVSALECDEKRQARDDEEMLKDLEMWQDTEIWND